MIVRFAVDPFWVGLFFIVMVVAACACNFGGMHRTGVPACLID